MALENEINQRKFRTEYQKARINIIYTYNWLSERINSIFKDWDITPQQFNILRILRGEGKPLSTLQIRQRMLDKMSDTSRIVDRLLKKGLVRKTPNDEDRRLVDVVITPKGRKLLEKIDPFEENADKMMMSLTEEETKTLNHLLDMLRNTATIFLFLLGSVLFAKAQPKYEFRAAWVASVENIDWPS
ncbi:MAG TPA: MarR family transcriptional regulator, partial [Puia sp.]|nr:MarR family transcriptional regulator [Puia sp.]